MGARSLVVLDCAFPGRATGLDHSLIAEVLLYTALRERCAPRPCSKRRFVAEQYSLSSTFSGPAKVQIMSPLDFSHTAALIEAAYTAAKRYLAGLSVEGPGLYGGPGIAAPV